MTDIIDRPLSKRKAFRVVEILRRARIVNPEIIKKIQEESQPQFEEAKVKIAKREQEALERKKAIEERVRIETEKEIEEYKKAYEEEQEKIRKMMEEESNLNFHFFKFKICLLKKLEKLMLQKDWKKE